MHTFGGDLKWNPHIHVLYTEGGIVTYWYENKIPKEKREITVDVLEFIGKITQHIHPKGFRVVPGIRELLCCRIPGACERHRVS